MLLPTKKKKAELIRFYCNGNNFASFDSSIFLNNEYISISIWLVAFSILSINSFLLFLEALGLLTFSC